MIKLHRTKCTHRCVHAHARIKLGKSEEDGWIVSMPIFWLCVP